MAAQFRLDIDVHWPHMMQQFVIDTKFTYVLLLLCKLNHGIVITYHISFMLFVVREYQVYQVNHGIEISY